MALNRETKKVSLNHTLPTSPHHSTQKVLKSHAKSSQADLPHCSAPLKPTACPPYSSSLLLYSCPRALLLFVTALELILSLHSLLSLSTLHRPHGKHRLHCWWRHRLRGSVFTVPLLRNLLHNPVVPALLGTDDIENTASFTVASPNNGLFTKNQFSWELVYQHVT
jgi:hypothetical protein